MTKARGQSYSQDIRDRVFALFDGGMPVCRVAQTLLVSSSHVSKALARRRTTGELSARPQQNHVRPKLADHLDVLRAQVTACPDATLSELRQWLLVTRDIRVSRKLVHTTLCDLNLTFKKSRSGQPNRTGQMLRRRGRIGAPASIV